MGWENAKKYLNVKHSIALRPKKKKRYGKFESLIWLKIYGFSMGCAQFQMVTDKLNDGLNDNCVELYGNGIYATQKFIHIDT